MKTTTRLSVIAIAAIILGSAASVAIVTPASAHTADTAAAVTCEPDGSYSVLWVYTQTNTPDDTGTDVKVITHLPDGTLLNEQSGQLQLNAAPEHAVNYPGVPTLLGNFQTSFVQTGIPGTATTAHVGIQTDWLGWGATETDRDVTLPGTCVPFEQTPPVTLPPAVEVPPAPAVVIAPETPAPAPTAEAEELASTGVDILPLAGSAAFLLLVGGALWLVRRRPRSN